MRTIQSLSLVGAALLSSTLACQPVVTIGWTEVAIIAGLAFLLFAPLLLRLFRLFARSNPTPDDGEE